jgi:hypothetical protein
MRGSRLAVLLLATALLAVFAASGLAKGPTRLRDCTAGGPEYSPLHFWAPALYRWRSWFDHPSWGISAPAPCPPLTPISAPPSPQAGTKPGDNP